ncbi:MAG: gas vesicle structural protein GvpA [Anaerolineae bacterium]|nr:gas vesicle structural protein GvpA [Gemmatimonadaceae bacterium]
MALERSPGGTSLIDVLDRVLDKGIVIDAWERVSLVGIDLVTVEARIVVASMATYLKYSEAIGITATTPVPHELAGSANGGESDGVLSETAELDGEGALGALNGDRG